MARRPGNKFALILSCLLLSACGGCGAAQEPEAQDTKTTLGLFTSLPIYWGEASDISQILDEGDAAPSWARFTRKLVRQWGHWVTKLSVMQRSGAGDPAKRLV